MAHFHGLGSTVSRLHSFYEVAVYIVPLSPQEFLVLSLSTLESPCGFEPGIPGSGIQHLNHKAIAHFLMSKSYFVGLIYLLTALFSVS